MKQNLRNFLVLFLLVMGVSVSWAEDLSFSEAPKGTAHTITWKAVDGAKGYRLTIVYDNGNGVAVSTPKVVDLDADATSYEDPDHFIMKDGTYIEIKTSEGYSGTSWITFATRRVYYYVESGVYFKTNLRYPSDYIPANDKYSTSSIPTKDGYTFKGWSLTPNGEAIKLPYELTQARTNLYGVWEIKPTPAPSTKVCDVTTNYAGWVSYTNIGYDGERYDVKVVPSDVDKKYGRDEVKTYKANEFTGHQSVLMETVTNIPYGEGVFIYGTPETTYDIVTTATTSSNYETNLIVGVTEETGTETKAGDKIIYNTDSEEYGTWLNADGCDYVLLTDENNDRSGLYKVDDDLFMPAEHAYLHVFDPEQRFDYEEDLMAKQLTFEFVDNVSGITSVKATDNTKANVLYNLAGQKVGSDYKGVVIDGSGKKSINK